MNRLFSNKKIGQSRQDIRGYLPPCTNCQTTCTGGCTGSCTWSCSGGCGYSCNYNCIGSNLKYN